MTIDPCVLIAVASLLVSVNTTWYFSKRHYFRAKGKPTDELDLELERIKTERLGGILGSVLSGLVILFGLGLIALIVVLGFNRVP